MRCQNCGWENPNGLTHCEKCGTELTVSSSPTPNKKPNNHLVWAIIVTVLFCWPFGIPAIIQATRVDKYWNAGDYAAAQHASRKAKKWSWIAFACGLALQALLWTYWIFVIAAIAAF